MKLREVLATNLKHFRLAAGLSQEELAHRADLDRTYVSSLERCNYAATVDMIEKLARELEIDAALLDLEAPNPALPAEGPQPPPVAGQLVEQFEGRERRIGAQPSMSLQSY